MAAGDHWSRQEVEAAVAAYRAMLRAELLGEHVNKAKWNRQVQAVTDRTKGSVEFKHQNITAILNRVGLPSIEGYKPRANFQALLQEVAVSLIASDPEIQKLARAAAEREKFATAREGKLEAFWVDTPRLDETTYGSLRDKAATPVPRLGVNYLEIEAQNRRLGAAGEELVVALEQRRLFGAGRKQLAERVDQVSRSRGDGLGYDVLSFEEDGRERLIEVKTTQFGKFTPFFATNNEVAVSQDEAERYQVYRIFSFGKNPRLFALPGAMTRSCQLDPVVFTAMPR